VSRRASLIASVAAACALAAPVAAAAKPAAPPAMAGPSKAVTTDIIDAVAQEQNRAMTALQIPGAPRPYNISYKITEVEVNDAAASLGFATSKKERHFVSIEARVRVGNPDFDNGNFVVPQAASIDGVSSVNLPLEATPRMARRAAWLVTDAAYKEALIQLRAKMDAHKAGGVGVSAVPSWTTEPPLVSEKQVDVPANESADDMAVRAAAVSTVFRGDAFLRDSRVALTSFIERRWYVTSDGTSATDTRRVSGVIIVATAQAADGQELSRYFVRYGHTARDLPGDAELEAEAKTVAEQLKALRTAPVIDQYSGPILFEGEGAAGVVRETLAPHLGGTPLPEGLRPQQAKQFGGALTKKVGLKVMSAFLSIIDDPTSNDLMGKPVIGGYKLDDEGVPGQRVDVVKQGFLKALLTSRTPSRKGATSNGHARRTIAGGMFHGSATNLILSGRGGMSRRALEHKLLAEARSEGLEYGLVISVFDDAAITAAPEFSRRELVQMLSNADLELPPPTSLAYRLYPNGKRELIRGVQLQQVPIRAWKDVSGVGNKPIVYNYLAPDASYIEQKITGVDQGFVPSGGIESAIVTPDLLFKELDVVANTGGQYAKPLIPPPATK
jgi:TldD protein